MRSRLEWCMMCLYVIVLVWLFLIIINIDQFWINHVMQTKNRIMSVVSQYINVAESDFVLSTPCCRLYHELTVHFNTVSTCVHPFSPRITCIKLFLQVYVWLVFVTKQANKNPEFNLTKPKKYQWMDLKTTLVLGSKWNTSILTANCSIHCIFILPSAAHWSRI